MLIVGIYNSVATATLTSSLDGRQTACPGEVVTYTCNVTLGYDIGWTVPPVLADTTLVVFIPANQRVLRCNDFPAIQCADLDFQANLTAVGTVVNGAADMTSTFRFTARAGLNKTVVECSALTSSLTTSNHTFTVAGELYYFWYQGFKLAHVWCLGLWQ